MIRFRGAGMCDHCGLPTLRGLDGIPLVLCLKCHGVVCASCDGKACQR